MSTLNYHQERYKDAILALGLDPEKIKGDGEFSFSGAMGDSVIKVEATLPVDDEPVILVLTIDQPGYLNVLKDIAKLEDGLM